MLNIGTGSREIDSIIKLLQQSAANLKELNSQNRDNVQESLFMTYQEEFLNSYIRLFTTVYSNRKNIFTEFSFRTLLEMGVEDSFIIFNKRVPEKDKRLYILLTLLADYGLTSVNDTNFEKWFSTIFDQNVAMLTPVQVVQIRQFARKLITKKIDDEYNRNLKNVRRLIFKKKKEIIDRLVIKDRLLLDIDNILSEHSHILHGNPYLLRDLLTDKNNLHIKNTLTCLKISGSEMLKNISFFVNNNAKIVRDINVLLLSFNLS